MVEKQDTDHCSVLGGQQMILTGQNFSSDSKVVFMEKSQGEWAAGGGGVRVRVYFSSSPHPAGHQNPD